MGVKQPLRILLVDDESLFRRSIAQALTDRLPDAMVVSVANGKEAMRVIASGRVNLVITDVRMPEMDGIALLSEMSHTPYWCPVIVVSAHGTPALRQEAEKGGAVRFLEKPIEFEQLFQAIDEALRPTEGARVGVRGVAQLIALEGRSCTLRVQSDEGRDGLLAFDGGRLVHAECGALVGDHAARALFALRETQVRVHPGGAGSRATVRQPLEALLEASAPTDSVPQQGAPQNQTTKDEIMASIQDSMNEAMNMDGALACALVDWESGLTLGTGGGGDGFDVGLAASGNTQVVRCKMEVMKSLGLKGGIEDILITLDDQIHLIRPLSRVENLFMYVALDKKKGNLGLARHKLKSIEKDLEL